MNAQRITLQPATHADGRALLVATMENEGQGADHWPVAVQLTASDATDLMASLAIWLASLDETSHDRLTDVLDVDEDHDHRGHPGQSCAEAHG